MKLDRVVIAIDFSERSIAAARWAAKSFAPSAELVLVHVLTVPRVPRFLSGRYPMPGEADAWRARAQLQLRQLGRQLRSGIVWDEVRVGKPDDQVLAVARDYDADLIVVGSHRDRLALWNRLGSTAERVLRGADVPVLVVHGAPQVPPRRLLAAVDDSRAAAAVIVHAHALAARFGASGKLAHVLPEQMIQRLTATGEVRAHHLRSIEAEQRLVVDTYDWLVRQVEGSNGAVAAAVMLGDAAEAILKEAMHAGVELVVLGRERGTAGPRHPLGSVSSAVLRGAKCPVLVIPRGDAHGDAAAHRSEEWGAPEQPALTG